MVDFDKELSDLLDSAAANGKEFFDNLGNDAMNEIAAAFLRSSFGADTFCDIDINNHMASIIAAPTYNDRERFGSALCTVLSNVAWNATEDYVDKILPGKLHDYRYYAKQDHLADHDAMLDQALTGIGGVFNRFSVK